MSFSIQNGIYGSHGNEYHKYAELFTTQFPFLTTDKEEDFFKNILGKGENAGHQHFLLSPKYFLPITKKNLINFAVCTCC